MHPFINNVKNNHMLPIKDTQMETPPGINSDGVSD